MDGLQWKTPQKKDDLGVHPFLETPMSPNTGETGEAFPPQWRATAKAEETATGRWSLQLGKASTTLQGEDTMDWYWYPLIGTFKPTWNQLLNMDKWYMNWMLIHWYELDDDWWSKFGSTLMTECFGLRIVAHCGTCKRLHCWTGIVEDGALQRIGWDPTEQHRQYVPNGSLWNNLLNWKKELQETSHYSS